MAARRIRAYSPIQISLKNGYQNPVCFTPFQTIVPMLSRKAPQYYLECGALHDEANSRLRIKTAIMKNQSETIHGAQCILKIYGIDVSTLNETLIYTAPTVTSPDQDGFFRISVTESNLVREIQGEFDYVLEASVKRFKKTFKKRFYFNQLGLYDFALRIRQRMIMHEVERKSRGVGMGW